MQAILAITSVLTESRPSTTFEEVQKKIQTLRTQIGQEFTKIEKSRDLNDASLIYSPKVWWYKHFEWIAYYMKSGRSDKATPLADKIKMRKKSLDDSYNLFNDDEEEMEHQVEIEEEDVYNDPPSKRSRRILNASVKSDDNQTVEYIINDHNEIFSETPLQAANTTTKILEIQPQHVITERIQKRSKKFGKYVATLMEDITSDQAFFDTQTQILEIIKKSLLKNS